MNQADGERWKSQVLDEIFGSVLIREGEAPAEPSRKARQEPRPPELGHYEIFVALAASAALDESLVYKGARVLNVRLVGQEFRVACQSRYIDCQGLATFQEHWAVTRETYEGATIPKDIPFEEADATLVGVVGFLKAQGIVPFTFPLPNGAAG
jgi:hypothetical protein